MGHSIDFSDSALLELGVLGSRGSWLRWLAGKSDRRNPRRVAVMRLTPLVGQLLDDLPPSYGSHLILARQGPVCR